MTENPCEDFHAWITRTGGHNGGWSQDDHLHMVTLTHRHANWRKMPERFMEEVWSGVRAVPSREHVRRHVEWYMEYCVRLASKFYESKDIYAGGTNWTIS